MGKKARQEKAREAMAAVNAEEKRRKRATIIGGAAVGAIVIALLGMSVMLRASNSSSTTVAADPSAPLPTGVVSAEGKYPYGWPVNDAGSSTPTLEVFEDYQCPACGALEKSAVGDGIQAMAKDGKINLVYRPIAFLDNNLRNGSSAAAMSAFGCAIDAGVGEAYHNAVYDNQPNEGVGYTPESLLQFGKDAGLDGAKYDSFAACVKSDKYKGWAANATNLFFTEKIPGTPYVLLNGKPLDQGTVYDGNLLAQAIADAAAGKPVPQNTPSGSTSAEPFTSASPAATPGQ